MELKYLDEVKGHKTVEERTEAEERIYNSNKKKLFTAYPLLLILGTIGVHRFYLGHNRAAYILISLTALSLFSEIYSGVFDNTVSRQIGLLIIPIGIAIIYEFIMLPFLVKKTNSKIRHEIVAIGG
ncbi:MAG: TM2 domain-containing protein [Robiginitomaculum sp.]|nr:TM2 domain-containing protein [Robiginitomaculum sp.]